MRSLVWLAVLAPVACRSTPAAPPDAPVPLVAAAPPTPSAAPARIEALPAIDEPIEPPKGVVIGTGTRVLLFGDSMVKAGLGFRLAQLVQQRGGIYLEDYLTSSSTKSWSEGDRLEKLLAEKKPDVIFVVLGSNEVFLMNPHAADHVQKIVARFSGKPCVWIGPPVWSTQKGIVEIERDNSPPCEFFDSSNLKLERQWDKIHPNTKGGSTWAAAVWEATVRPPPAG